MQEKVKQKVKKGFIITGIICFFFMIFFFIIYFNDNLRFKLEYEYLNSIPYDNGKKIPVHIPLENHIQYVKGKKIIEVLKEETGIVYFGYNSCPWCRNVVETVISVAKKNDIKNIYYVDTHSDFSSIYQELMSILFDYLRENEEGEKNLAVPDVYFIKDGKIIGHHISTVEGYRNPYLGMDEKQKKELEDIYQSLIEEMKK